MGCGFPSSICAEGRSLVLDSKQALAWFRTWAEKRTKSWDPGLLFVVDKNRSLHYELEVLEEEKESGCISSDEGDIIWVVHHTLVGILSKGRDCLQAYHHDHLMQLWKDLKWRWRMQGLGLAPRLY